MTGGVGKVIKAARVKKRAEIATWRAPKDELPQGEIEVIREGGAVVAIRVTCGCGQVHEMEMVPLGQEEGEK
jgi:hypothetical protein